VTLTVPANLAPNVATNTITITASFSEEMAANTFLTPANAFTVTCTAPCVSPTGTVSYVVGSGIAVFTVTSGDLAAATTYTATIYGIAAGTFTAATDLAGNALAGNPALLPAASNYVWTFTTAAKDTTPPLVSSTTPAAGAAGVDVNLAAISATFNEAMNPLPFLTASTFTLTGPTAATSVAGTFSYNAANNIVTMNIDPTKLPLAFSTAYTATITTAAKDVAGNALVVPAVNGLPVPNPWTFTTAAALVPPPPALAINLRSAATFGIASRAGMTSTGVTVVNGDVALTPTATCTDATGVPPPLVAGSRPRAAQLRSINIPRDSP
jgi:hypothetical protein